MSDTNRKLGTIAAAYVIIGLLTWGWSFNHPEHSQLWKCYDTTEATSKFRNEFAAWCGPAKYNHTTHAAFSGVAWPLVATGEVVLLITKWP